VATVRVPGEAGQRRVVTETFGTMTPDLIALREWLQAYGVTHVALESTGVYWKPVYYVLEDAFELLLINRSSDSRDRVLRDARRCHLSRTWCDLF
jgi:hypothetical protein